MVYHQHFYLPYTCHFIMALHYMYVYTMYFLQSPKNCDFYFPSERLISVREVQMYKMHFLKEKNAFTKEIFTLSIKVYEYILEYNDIFVHIMFALYFFTFNFFRPRGFSV